MKDLHFILLLLRKEFLLEFRTRSAISGIFLYVISTLFVVYETFVKIQPNVWNTLFWIILLFVAVNAMVKSFVQEKGNRVLYYYSLLNPSHVLIAKIVYNTLLLLVLSLLIWGLFIFFGDNPVKDIGLFLLLRVDLLLTKLSLTLPPSHRHRRRRLLRDQSLHFVKET